MTRQLALGVRVSAGLIVIALLNACSGPVPRPPSSTPTQTSAAAEGAQLSVSGSGSIECLTPHGCLASFVAQPETWDPAADWEPLPDDPHFEVMDGGAAGQRLVSGEAIGAPDTLAPGRYRLAIAVSEVSDVSSMTPGGAIAFPFMWTEVRCTRDLEVEADTGRIDVDVFFGNPCRIDLTVDR